MTEEEFRNLRRGDLVRHVSSDVSLIVDDSYDYIVIATRTFCASNPSEWELVAKANYVISAKSVGGNPPPDELCAKPVVSDTII